MAIDFPRLSNVIFDHGVRLTESEFTSIQESIENEQFTLNEHVIGYKNAESVYEKIPFRLKDGKLVLVNEDTIEKIRSLEIDKEKLTTFMNESYENFSKVISMVLTNE
jgi:hypothetical protein